MPELPEIETIKRGLDPLLLGRRVLGVEVRERRLREPIVPRALARLRGATLAGVGNIYACEALFRAGIGPRRQVRRIGTEGWERLLGSLREVLGEAIEAGGTTLRDFLNAEGEVGYFALSLRVYDRAGKPCGRCGALIRRIVQAGRST